MVHFLIVEGCGGLIEDDQFRLEVQRLADLQQLLLAGLEIRDHGVRIDLHAQSLEQFLRFRAHALLVQHAHLIGIFPVQEHVLKDLEVVEQVQFLMHERDPQLLGLRDRDVFELLPVKFDRTAVPWQDTGQNIHQRRFSRAVLSQKGMDFAALYSELYAFQNGDAAERLPYVSHFQQTHVPLLPPLTNNRARPGSPGPRPH